MYYIYKLTFKNNKSYIGYTKDIIKRIKTHVRVSKYKQYPISKAIRSMLFFSVEIIGCSRTQEDVMEFEKLCIKQFNSFIKNNGYNATLGGDGISGFIVTDEFKNKIKAGLKKLGKRNGNKASFKKGNTPWNLGTAGSGIMKSNSGSFKKGDQRLQVYAKKRKGYIPWNKGKQTSDEQKLKLSISHGGKCFNVLDKENNIVGEYINQSQCAKELNLNVKNIQQCLNGSKKTHKGYKFLYK